LENGALHLFNHLRFFFLILVLVCSFPDASSQRKGDIGIIGGASYYMGEINPVLHFYKPSPSLGALYRHNFNPRNAVRFHAIYGNLRGSDLDFTNDFQQARGLSFHTSFLELAAYTEFYFFPYQYGKRKDRYTPYMTAGLGYDFVFDPDKRGTTGLIMTYGAGFKFNVNKHISAGCEWSFRKTFNDRLDGIVNPGTDNAVFYHNNDWYSIVGIFVTYKFLNYLLECPAYDE
jgi:opacity protein-like surface antigen